MFADYARELYRDACQKAAGLDPSQGAKHIAAAAKLGDRSAMVPALALAQTNRLLVVKLAELDADPLLLGVRNGVVDLRDGSFHQHDPEVFVTRSAACDFIPGAQCPTFTQAVKKFQPDPEMRDYLQRLFGYSLTGLIGEHILPFHYGTGGNGKGTILEQVIFKILGEYAVKLTDGLVYVNKHGKTPELELAGLVGKRFALGEENDDGGFLNEKLLKGLSGGDRMKGRFHYKDFFEFDPTTKIHLVGNHRPKISGRDDGIWRRFRLVDWPVKIPKEEQDFQFWEKLKPEFPGVRKRGTLPPDSVLASTSKYREDCDTFGEFLREKTIPDPAGTLSKFELFELYKDWCDDQEIPERYRYTKRKVGFLMIERSYDEKKTAGGLRVWAGLRRNNSTGE
jgi:putative DNA primase/helicase